MAVYTKTSKLYEPVFEDPSIVSVLNRFGIFLGVGDDTIEEGCRKVGADVDFLLAVINTYLNQDYFPEKIANRTHLPKLIDYLEKTDLYYRHVQLPNIDRHFNLLLNRGNVSGYETDGASNICLLNKFYKEVKEELESFITNDLNYWFPSIKRGEVFSIDQIAEGCGQDNGVRIELPFDNVGIEDKIRDLVSFFIIHLKGDYDHNLCIAVVSSIFTLEKDIRQNNRIRDRILKPLCLK